MRKFMISAAAAILSFTGVAPLAEASPVIPMVVGHQATFDRNAVILVDHYYGHERKHYRKKQYYDEEQEYCVWKKVKRYDEYGDVYYERVKVCH